MPDEFNTVTEARLLRKVNTTRLGWDRKTEVSSRPITDLWQIGGGAIVSVKQFQFRQNSDSAMNGTIYSIYGSSCKMGETRMNTIKVDCPKRFESKLTKLWELLCLQVSIWEWAATDLSAQRRICAQRMTKRWWWFEHSAGFWPENEGLPC